MLRVYRFTVFKSFDTEPTAQTRGFYAVNYMTPPCNDIVIIDGVRILYDGRRKFAGKLKRMIPFAAAAAADSSQSESGGCVLPKYRALSGPYTPTRRGKRRRFRRLFAGRTRAGFIQIDDDRGNGRVHRFRSRPRRLRPDGDRAPADVCCAKISRRTRATTPNGIDNNGKQ